MKRTISMILALILSLSACVVIPVIVASAANIDRVPTGATSGSSGHCWWSLDNDGVLTIGGYGNGKMMNYLYDNDNTYNYTTSPAPWKDLNVTKVIIKDGVTWIGDNAFNDCKNITSVEIPDSVIWIGEGAFLDCVRLTAIDFPNSIRRISKNAFRNCISLTSIVLPESLTQILQSSFNNCFRLKSVKIPDSVIEIFPFAFEGCSGLTSIDIPDSVTRIGTYAFNHCFNILSVKIPNSVKTIDDSALGYRDYMPYHNKVNGFTIIGDVGSEAQRYANDNGFKFIPIDNSAGAVSGDVTGDGKTNVQDCTAILRYVRKLDKLSDDQLKIGDVTGDGKVNVQDVTRILRHVRNIEVMY